MKPISIGIFINTNEEHNKNYVKHILNKGNSLLAIPNCEYEDSKLDQIIIKEKAINAFFLDRFTNSFEKIEIFFEELDLNLFFESIETIVDITFENTKELSNEPFDSSSFAKNEIIGLMQNTLMKYQYNDPKDLIYLIADIFKNVLINHKLKNGNKRVASMLLSNMLYQQGLFLTGSLKLKNKQLWKLNEDKFIQFIEKYHVISTSSNFIEENDALLLEIYEWIYNSIHISLNF